MNDMYTGRSTVETYQSCPRMRFNQNHLEGVGLVGVQKNVPLVTGGAIHRGVEVLLNQVKDGKVVDVEIAVGEAVEAYTNAVGREGFSGKDMQSDSQQWFTFCEQKALTEALIRCWYLRELPNILSRYKVVAVEREIEPIRISEGVLWQARIDAEFQEISSGDYHNYSLKSVNRFDERNEKVYRSDLQGVTEIWSVEEDNRREIARWQMMIDTINGNALCHISDSQLSKILNWALAKKPKEKKVMGVRFCFLVKGVRSRDKSDDNSIYKTASPLVRGWKNYSPGGVSYAHSFWFPNSNNKSGKGALGRGWEEFQVWQSDISIKTWIDMLNEGVIQPEVGDILGQQVLSVPEYFRDEWDIKVGMAEITLQERKVKRGLEALESAKWNDEKGVDGVLAEYFPHYKKTCYFYYGNECPYLDLCWKPEVMVDPMGSGLYQIREAHHSYEKEANR